MNTQERVDGLTPNGGDHMIAYYLDAEGNPAAKDKAVQAEIVEYKGEEVVQRTYGTIAHN